MRTAKRDWVYRLTEGKCFYCFRGLAHDEEISCDGFAPDGKELLTVDHVIPRSRGGVDNISNLVPSCNFCNAQKREKTQQEYRAWLQNKHGGPVRFFSDTKKLPLCLQGY